MAYGRINITTIRKEVASYQAIDKFALSVVSDRFNAEKANMLLNFDKHVVTQEILQGPEGDNLSNTLRNAEVPGNLCAFLGFENGEEENIIRDLKHLIEISTILNQIPVKSTATNGIRYRFTAKIPTEEQLEAATPVHWGETARGRSWLAIVENGTNSFAYYLYKKFEAGRSQEALQAKTKTGKLIVVNQGDFKPTPYTSEIIKKFVETVGSTQL